MNDGGPVTLRRQDDVAIVTVDNPPVNAMGHAVRVGLVEAARAVASDDAVAAVVLLCAGRTFVAGADITEFGRPALSPTLRDCNAAIEALFKPVLALLHGTALGGGLELALSCHYRVIDPSGSVGLPEVTLGLIPGAGGTLRLPRLIGVGPALDMITSGRRVTADEALRLGLVDAVTTGDRLAFALAFLDRRRGRAVPRLSDRPRSAADPEALAAVRAAVRKKAPGQIAPLRAIDVVEATAALDLVAGERLEQAQFDALRTAPQSAALRHIFFAERAIAKVPGLGQARPVDTVGIVGGGTMGAGIAAACLLAGLNVRLIERDAEALEAGQKRIGDILGEAVRRGKLSEADHGPMMALRFGASLDYAALGEADLIVEAAFESMPVKQEVFRALDGAAKTGAVLATNTSYLDVAAIAGMTARPADVIGLHFFSPAHVMKLVEVVAPSAASPDAVATGFALAKRLGKLGVWSGNREGFIGNRIMSAYRRAADHMVEDGASPWAVDAAFRDYGFPMGVFAMQDMAGLDIGWATRRRLAPTRDPAERYVAVSDRLCERGWFGRKSGRGYYLYEDGRVAPNPAVDAIVDDERRAKGMAPRTFTSEAIQHRILLATVNEGARILDEGVALRAGDIDVVMVNGYGFPRWRGGPMHAAEALGLGRVCDDLAAVEGADPLWRVSPLLRRGAAAGGVFPV